MKKIIIKLLILPFSLLGYSKPRPTSEPFISGDTVRNMCQHIFDETGQPFSPENIKCGDTVFVYTDDITSSLLNTSIFLS